MDKKIILTTSILISTLFSLEAKETSSSLDERVAIKKLSQYWEEKDTQRVKATLSDFLQKYPQSTYTDQLYAMQGDLHFSEKNYPEAALAYKQIQGKEYKRKSAFHYLHTLYALADFKEFINLAPYFLNDPHSTQSQIETITFEMAEAYQALGQLSSGEERSEFFKKAIKYYEALTNTEFEMAALDPLAHLYSSLELYSKASAIYLRWAEKDQSKQETLLFQAASMQIHYDKKSALQTFDRVFKMKGPLAEKSGYNMIALLFQMGRYSDVIMAAIYVDQTVPADKLGTLQYYVGKSLFYEKNFDAAADTLEEALDKQGNETLREGIILTLISCAKEINDLSLCDRMIKKLSPSEHMQEALLVHAQLCRNHKEWSVAREDIEKLLLDNPEHKEKEALLYDIAVLLMQEGKHEESADTFDTFIAAYPNSSYRKDALSNNLSLRVDLVKKATGIEKKSAQERLAALLEIAFNEPFDQEEKKQIHFLLGQTHFQLQHQEESTHYFLEFVKNFPQDPSCKDAYLLLAALHQDRDDINYVLYAEKALDLSSEKEATIELHRHLFNSYLRLCEKSSDEKKEHLLEKAADHLFQVTDGSVNQENQRWLAGYYLKNNKDIKKAALVLEKLLKIHGEKPFLLPHTESETVRLALLYREMELYAQSVSLLKSLDEEQKNTPELEWKYPRMVRFELGKAYSLAGEPEKAIEIYQELIDSSSHLTSYFAIKAQLELAKIQLPQFNSENPEAALMLCDRLKEIEIGRQLSSEPLHTEAGLQYALIKTQLTQEPLKTEKHLSLLSQVKKGLLSFQDSQRGQSPEKEKLINQYLSYIEIELSHPNKESSQRHKQQLQELLLQVSNETLQERIVKDLEELDHTL